MSTSAFSYESLEKRAAPCPLCGQEKYSRLASHDRYGMGIVTVACDGCGLVMTNPMPSPDALADFYRNHYRQVYRRVDRPSLDHIRAYGLDRRAAYAADYLRKAGLLRPGCRVLDLGSAEGSLLKEIRGQFPDARLVGVEPGRSFAEFSRTYASCQIYDSFEQLVAAGESGFDCVTAVHVLEHVPDPLQFLRRVSPLLNEGGAFYVDVPDAAAYTSLDSLHIAHLFHFSRRTLEQACQRAGFRVELLESHEPPKHPVSLRVVLRAGAAAGDVPRNLPGEQAVHDRIRTIDRHAWRYPLSQWLPVRAVRKLIRLFRPPPRRPIDA